MMFAYSPPIEQYVPAAASPIDKIFSQLQQLVVAPEPKWRAIEKQISLLIALEEKKEESSLLPSLFFLRAQFRDHLKMDAVAKEDYLAALESFYPLAAVKIATSPLFPEGIAPLLSDEEDDLPFTKESVLMTIAELEKEAELPSFSLNMLKGIFWYLLGDPAQSAAAFDLVASELGPHFSDPIYGVVLAAAGREEEAKALNLEVSALLEVIAAEEPFCDPLWSEELIEQAKGEYLIGLLHAFIARHSAFGVF
jgi:hypothetical protein